MHIILTHADSDDPILSIAILFDKYNTAAKKYIRTAYYLVRFLDFDGEFKTSMLTKKFFKTLYKSGIINEDGNVDEDKARKFIRTYDEDIPTELILTR